MTISTPQKATAPTLHDIGLTSSRSAEAVLGGRRTVTLQSMVVALQGVCTEPEMFYGLDGKAWISGATGTVLLGPYAALTTDRYCNAVGIGSWGQACRLDGLFLAVKGTGLVEIRVFQARTGRSDERLACEVCALSAGTETVLDLSHYTLNGVSGAIWFEIRNCSADKMATVTGARYLTGNSVEQPMRLALCLAKVPEASDQDAAMIARFEQWCDASGKAGQAAVLRADAGTPPLAQLMLAKEQGFSHAVLMDPTTIMASETLDRVMTCLALSRDPQQALGAAVLDPAEKWMMLANGVSRDRNEKPAPKFSGLDLREPESAVAMECELAEGDAGDRLFQPEWLALSLSNLAEGDGAFDTSLRDQGYRLMQMTGVVANREKLTVDTIGPLVTLQHAIYPEAGLCTEAQMYFHADGPAGYLDSTETLVVEQGSIVRFDTYFNALNIGKWHATCVPTGLYLGLFGRGRVLVKVFHAIPDQSWELLCDQAYSLSPAVETMIDLSHYAKTAVSGMIYFELQAISAEVQLTRARYAVPGRINPDVRLCLSITTFKREAEVENTAQRMARYFKTFDFADQIHLNVIDNGDSADLVESPKITRIANANLGGAGGFTRGLIEAEAAGYSHVLFMDDDASIPMDALHRAYAFLTLSKDPKATVSGAMISNADKWRMWENGAVFDRNCRPQFNGVDLRSWTEVMNMEFTSASYRSPKMYGGWWFFAFPIAQVTHYPFPFFVRGDDINFSLANDFNITTLNGVVSFAEDFSDKESPMTLYLDLRNHFVQHLTLEKMEIGPLNIAKIGIGFFLRNIAKFQYETVDALLMAWDDVLKGPAFFAQNADASGQRAAVRALYKTEAWKPVSEMNMSERRRYSAASGVLRMLFRWTLNGHLVPFYRFWGNRVVLQPRDRNNYAPVWGSARITYLNSTRNQAYTVTQSKTRFAGQLVRLIWLTLRLTFGYRRLLASYRKGYTEITTPGFWQTALKLVKRPATPDLSAAPAKR